MKIKPVIFTALLALASQAFAADVLVSGKISSNTTWTSDNRYQLNGYVFVTNGATLTIQAGTVVQGRVSTGAGAAALVISQGAKIDAQGTALGRPRDPRQGRDQFAVRQYDRRRADRGPD